MTSKGTGPSRTSNKNELRGLNLGGSLQKPLVPPVLREVGKLAAGVASVSTNPAGSATGSYRSKYALQPGHSLMDWIRLGASGKDLTGVGSQAGHLSVTPTELAMHNKETDAWLCIRGRVYNVTAYFPFHPGGPDELMRGVGRDATSLFEEVHPWVNYDQILSKCYIGPLKTVIDENIFSQPTKVEQSPKLPTSVTNTPNKETVNLEPTLPKFDWIQKLNYITIIFYTGTFSNPMLEISQNSSKIINIFFTYHDYIFDNEIIFFNDVQWPCQTKVTCETGKIELFFKKTQSGIWENYGVLRQKKKLVGTTESKFPCKIINKIAINHNTSLIELERNDQHKIIVPLGKHVKVFATIKGEEISRSYTPVPSSLFSKFCNQRYTTDNICLMVKRYPDGNLSRIICDSPIGDILTMSKPLGTFDLQEIERRETFIVLAAGTGITPMFSIILFLLERRIRKCQKLRLLFFNRTSNDILFDKQFEELQSEDSRFTVKNILSQPDSSWTGLKGHISRSLLDENIKEHLNGTTYVKKDIYFMACGPTIFVTLTQQILKDLNVTDDQVHFFLG